MDADTTDREDESPRAPAIFLEWQQTMPAERGSSLFSYVFSVFFEYLQTKFLRDMINLMSSSLAQTLLI